MTKWHVTSLTNQSSIVTKETEVLTHSLTICIIYLSTETDTRKQYDVPRVTYCKYSCYFL